MSKVCWIDNKTLDKMRQEGVSHFPLETGGCLMGYKTKHGDAVITDFVSHGPNSKHAPYSFEGDTKWQNDEVRKIYDASEGYITYIGDWHTHPNNPTALSQMDIDCLKVISDAQDAHCENPIMLVMGFRLDVVSVFEYSETNNSLEIKRFDYEPAGMVA